MKFEEKDDQFREKLDKVNERFECLENVAGKGSQVNAQKIESLGDSFGSIESRFEEISHVMDNVLDRLHEFEAQRKNNLIFYGVPEENNESSVKLLGKVREVIRSQFGVQVSSVQPSQGHFLCKLTKDNSPLSQFYVNSVKFQSNFI